MISEEQLAAWATLFSYVVWSNEGYGQLWGGRTSEEAVQALCTITGLTREEIERVAFGDRSREEKDLDA